MIALIAHNNKKASLVNFVIKNIGFFSRFNLIATHDTANLLTEKTSLSVIHAPHGPEGGDLVIASKVVLKEVNAVFFFRDLLTPLPHEPDITALLRICDLHQIPLATNEATADCLVKSLCSHNNNFC